jgi:hypothetical protein
MIEDLLALKSEQQIIVACTLWRSWARWNKINAQQKEWSLGELIAQIKFWTSESKLYYKKEEATGAVKIEQKWSAPEEDWIKFNTDGSFFSESNHGGWGFVAWDQHGLI